MATAVSGRWGYGAWRPYVWLGIANLMTIAGLFVASARLRDRDGSRPRNWSTFFVVSSVLFVILTLVAGALLKLPLYL